MTPNHSKLFRPLFRKPRGRELDDSDDAHQTADEEEIAEIRKRLNETEQPVLQEIAEIERPAREVSGGEDHDSQGYAASPAPADDDALAKAVGEMLHGVPPRFHVPFIDTFELFARFLISIATVFSGTDIVIHAFNAIKHTAQAVYNITLEFEQLWCCENDPDAQAFLARTNSECLFMINEAADLLKPIVENVLSKTKEKLYIGTPFFLVGGFDCSDKSAASSNRKKLKHGIKNQEGKTHYTYKCIQGYFAQHKPPVLVLENLREIFSTDEDVTSDGDIVVADMRNSGYNAVVALLTKAETAGAATVKNRVYFVGISPKH